MDTILCRVKRAFPYAADHISVVILEAGSEHPIAADCVPGLVAEGYVEAIVAKPAAKRR